MTLIVAPVSTAILNFRPPTVTLTLLSVLVLVTVYKYSSSELDYYYYYHYYYRWIPKFNSPTTQFNLDPPTYNEITNVIRKMKPSGSPCPLDQISVICLKRCPYLRTYLTEIIHTAWSSGTVPSEWKKACTILIHKKRRN